MTTETASTSKPLLRSSLLQRQDTSNKFGILQDGVENVETLVKEKKTNAIQNHRLYALLVLHPSAKQ